MESDEPKPLSVYGRTKLEGARGARLLGRSLTVVVRGDREELPADDARPRRGGKRRSGRRRPAWVADVRRASRRGDEGGARPVRHVSPRRGRGGNVGRVRRGDLRGGGIDCRVRRITTAEFPRTPSALPIPSCGASGAPTLPHGAKVSRLRALGWPTSPVRCLAPDVAASGVIAIAGQRLSRVARKRTCPVPGTGHGC